MNEGLNLLQVWWGGMKEESEADPYAGAGRDVDIEICKEVSEEKSELQNFLAMTFSFKTCKVNKVLLSLYYRISYLIQKKIETMSSSCIKSILFWLDKLHALTPALPSGPGVY